MSNRERVIWKNKRQKAVIAIDLEMKFRALKDICIKEDWRPYVLFYSVVERSGPHLVQLTPVMSANENLIWTDWHRSTLTPRSMTMCATVSTAIPSTIPTENSVE